MSTRSNRRFRLLQPLPVLAGLLLLSITGAARAEAPPKIDQLVMREWAGPWGDVMAEVGTKFTAATGVKVVYDKRLDNVMMTLLQNAAANHRPPPVDVFYTFDFHGQKAKIFGLFDPLTVADVPNLAAMLPLAKPEGDGDGWTWINIAADVVGLVYRKDKFPNGPPDSYAVMFDPAFRGRVLFSTQPLLTMIMVSTVNHWTIPDDMDRIWDFIQTKVQPQEPILGNDPEVLGGFQRGEIDLAASFPANARALASSGVSIVKPKEGLIGGFEAVGIPKGLPPERRYWATRFVDFLLSEPVLAPYCHKLMVACLRQDIPPDADEQKDPAYPKGEAELKAIDRIPTAVFVAHESEWSTRYSEIMK